MSSVLWAVVGATGTGKSAASLRLHRELHEVGVTSEIVNADAYQRYRGMDIGTAKLSVQERSAAPHHLFDDLNVGDDNAVAEYQQTARATIEGIFARGSDAILVGGSGLYVSSVIFDFKFPPRDEEVRAQLEAELVTAGIAPLWERLLIQDPKAAEKIDRNNHRRVIRALEVLAQGAKTHQGALPETPELWHPQTVILGLERERSELVKALDDRVEDMWRSGIVAEAVAINEETPLANSTAKVAIGYQQALAQASGAITEAEAIAESQSLTRRYARRQVSWFKRYPKLIKIDAQQLPASLIQYRAEL